MGNAGRAAMGRDRTYRVVELGAGLLAELLALLLGIGAAVGEGFLRLCCGLVDVACVEELDCEGLRQFGGPRREGKRGEAEETDSRIASRRPWAGHRMCTGSSRRRRRR